jgi:hypothetical protein
MNNSPTIARVYNMNWRGWALPVFCLAMGSFSTAGLLTGKLQRDARFGIYSAVGVFLVGTLYTAGAFTTRITLTSDAMEWRNIFFRNRLSLDEIRGRREVVRKGLRGFRDIWRIVPKDGKGIPIDFGNNFTLDDAFFEWLSHIPDLDAEDAT